MLTYSDAIDHLVDYMGGAAEDREQRIIRRAIQIAYRDITEVAEWSYYLRKYRIVLPAQYAQGTCSYSTTTGIVTIAGNTDDLPTWTAEGVFRVGSTVSEVAARLSATTFSLDATNRPDATIASGTAYTLSQDSYPLPEDFVRMYRPLAENSGWFNSYIEPEEWWSLERRVFSTGTPFYWTVIGDNKPNRYGRHCIKVYPIPTTLGTYDFLYRHRPRAIRRTGTSETASYTGTVSGSAGGTTLTFSGATLAANMVGCVVRLSDSTTVAPDGAGSLNPFQEEVTLYSVNTGAGTAVTQTALTYAYSGNTFRISDPLDLDPVVYTPFLRGLEWQYQMLSQGSTGTMQLAKNLYNMAVREGLENDLRRMENAGLPRPRRFADDPYEVGYQII